MRRIFVSSVGGALAPYRRAVVDICHRLGLVPVHMEEFGTDPAPPLEVCLRLVESADAMVVLVAHRAGRVPPGETLTYTELEHARAVELGIDVHAFVVDEELPWLPEEVREPEAWRVRAFVDRLRASHTTQTFRDVPKFREDVMAALMAYRREEARPVATPRAYVARHPFTGRADDLRLLDDWAASDDSTMVVESIGGVGKTALAWQWARHAGPFAGRRSFWWSFYGGSASMRRCLHELAAFLSGRALEEVRELATDEVLAVVSAGLDAGRHLVVLDGLERLLVAYHRLDPSALRDDEVDGGARSLIEPDAAEALRVIAGATSSKVLITTRLMPRALETPARTPLVGVRHHTLRGLDRSDTAALVARLGVRGSRAGVTAFFDRVGNHPLLIGVVAGLVNEYRPRPGDFDAWAADPDAGGSLRLADLDMAQRRTHVLAMALRGLGTDQRRLLGWLSVLSGAVPYSTVEAVNPFVPPPPRRRAPTDEEISAAALAGGDVDEVMAAMHRGADAELRTALGAYRITAAFRAATRRLDRALAGLEDRGLLLWDRETNTYDLHPVVRAVARDRLGKRDLARAHESVRDHFGTMPTPGLATVASVEDLNETLTVFRSLVSCECWTEAFTLYGNGLGQTLRNRLAAFSTLVEILEPFESGWPVAFVSQELATAYRAVGRHPEAIGAAERGLRRTLDSDSVESVLSHVVTLAETCWAGMRFARTRAYLDVLALPAFTDVATALPGPHIVAARLAVVTGDLRAARRHLARAKDTAGARVDLIEEVTYWREVIANARGQVVRPRRTGGPPGPGLLGLRSVQRRLVQALAVQDLDTSSQCAAELVSRLADSGCDTTAATALVALLETEHDPVRAAAMIDDVVIDLDSTSGFRPYYEVAVTLCELGREEEAVPFALRAYEQGWGDGPPNTLAAQVAGSAELLGRLGVEVPALPVADAATVHVPLLPELRTFADRVTAGVT